MSKVVILGGAGGMGSMAIKDLVLNKRFSEIVIADINIEAANQIVQEINNDLVSTASINVTDRKELIQLLSDTSIVINFVGPFYRFAPMIIEACMEAKTNYVDICDDYDAAEEILKMDKRVKDAGITVLTGMGTSPGITNILVKMGMDQLDETEEVETIWVMGESETGSAILYHVFHGGTGLVPGYSEGKQTMIKPFQEEGSLVVEFPEPLGRVKVYDVGHPEPITIPHFYPEVKRVTNKGALLPSKIVDNFKKLFDLGFGSTTPINVNGTDITPRDFAVRFLQENPELLAVGESNGLGGLKVIVKGKKEGKDLGFVYTTVSSEPTAASVAIPAVVGAELIKDGKVDSIGVIAPEVLNPMDVFDYLGSRKSVNEASVSSGLIIDMILDDGSIQSIKKGRPLTSFSRSLPLQ
ncbi:saccharopine dehydrogenase family protein [Siminovitchia terrae]|uniref:saccharopine dehydrogenase family protein n=1 Tax=Siminovitchia terrae TaxID=1914933 RepID=UPI0028A869C3|nr:saccharopine dehydrogenase NADP-binding domain-containing protein [Siminovitchia terrae]